MANATRAVSPIVGVLALVALTVCLATVVAVGIGAWSFGAAEPTAVFDLSADADRSRIAIVHVAGDPVDVADLTVTVRVNGAELARQPPVPYVGAKGFDGAPAGAFNAKADSEWTPGERAGVTIAETNGPRPSAGDSVTVTLAVDGHRVAELETTAA